MTRACPSALRPLSLLLVVCLSAGCAHYEYDVVDPPDLRRAIGGSADLLLTRGPLRYRLRSYENHLVIRVENSTAQRIQLLGGSSFVTDPHGERHPLPGGTIAPAASIKLILPPLRPAPVPTGPGIGFGFYVDAAREPAGGEPASNDSWTRPRYALADPLDQGEFWDWEGETDVRLGLTFRLGDGPPFVQAFVFRQRKT